MMKLDQICRLAQVAKLLSEVSSPDRDEAVTKVLKRISSLLDSGVEEDDDPNRLAAEEAGVISLRDGVHNYLRIHGVVGVDHNIQEDNSERIIIEWK